MGSWHGIATAHVNDWQPTFFDGKSRNIQEKLVLIRSAEEKNSSSLREDVLAQSSHFKKWPILLYVIFVFESILFSFLFFFYSSLLHFTIIHTMIAIHSDTSSDCTCKPTRLPNMHRLGRQTVDDDVQHKYVE